MITSAFIEYKWSFYSVLRNKQGGIIYEWERSEGGNTINKLGHWKVTAVWHVLCMERASEGSYTKKNREREDTDTRRVCTEKNGEGFLIGQPTLAEMPRYDYNSL